MIAGPVHALLFDLDGTIVDNTPGIFSSLRPALEAVGVSSPEDLRPFVGPPLQEVFASFGLAPPAVERGVAVFRERYSAGALLDFEVYDGVVEMLDRIGAGGLDCAIATSKPEPYAEAILDAAGLTSRFAAVVGATLDGTRRHKRDVVVEALQRLGADAGPGAVMVGDRDHDLVAAGAAGLSGVGVLWGFGTPEELAPHAPVALVAHPLEVADLVGA